MRYRRLSYRYTMMVRPSSPWPFGDAWPHDRLLPLVQTPWQPQADTYETASTIEVVVDLAGVDEEDFEVQLFEDALVVEGHRPPPSCTETVTYHAVGIPHGPFRLEVSLPVAVDAEGVEARYDRGLLCVKLPKSREAS